jgi:nucleotide-binding universal stress UspA family protein
MKTAATETDRAYFERVLVPLDGSALAENALDPAEAIAGLAGVPLVLSRWSRDFPHLLQDRQYLQRLAGRPGLAEMARIVNHTAADGPVPDVLVADAARESALICMASHGRSGMGQAVIGSTTEEVLRQTRRPVLVVGPGFQPPTALAGRRLLACLDGSRFAERVVPVAAAWAERFGMELWLVESVAPDGWPGADDVTPAGDVVETGHLASVAAGIGSDVNFDVLHAKHPADAIVSAARFWPVGLVAMATHGRSGWSRIRLGSVAMHVVHRAPCPVLLLNPAADTADGV